MTNPPKFYQTLNQQPRSVARGKHRRANPSPYRHPVVRADHSPGGADQGTRTVWTVWNTGGPTVSWSTAGDACDFANCNARAPTIPYAGIRTGEIIGCRAWWLLPDNQLCSLAHKYIWTPNETVSGDINELADANWFKPIWAGVYAFKTPDDRAIDMDIEVQFHYPTHLYLANQLYTVLGLVFGTVKMWGDVVEHETGWRSEHAKINSIDWVHGECDIAALRAKYQVT